MTSAVPRTSKFARRALRRSPSTSRNSPAITSAQTGAFTSITQRQPGPSVRRPPSSTPAAEAAAPTPPQTPSALLRSPPSLNMVVRIDRAPGSISAAPAPWASRAPISIPDVVARPPAIEESVTSRVPVTTTRRRPSRSASRPPSSMNPP
ncbi:hypothetical protein K8Z49_39430 [Actinomadura madurae]